MKKQIHEEFQEFFVTLKDGAPTKESKKIMLGFLNGKHIHARSISAVAAPDGKEAPGAERLLIVAGYDEIKSNKMKYDVLIKELVDRGTLQKPIPSNTASSFDPEKLFWSESITKLNKVSKSKNIICHAVLNIGNKSYAVLLTAK